ncbi:uncharacterized protein CEXT_631931 [Caerostris extrusa]|uniref:Uncharacterized protein n=1 Tax=Caerostris extrusa TaxID=172846 RepID=A0AAV4T8A4_CAEEX|nr:uncharacterized protein CEXT_631931 [Caerostris extrusa]
MFSKSVWFASSLFFSCPRNARSEIQSRLQFLSLSFLSPVLEMRSMVIFQLSLEFDHFYILHLRGTSYCNTAVDAISATAILSINCVDIQFYMTSLFCLIEHLGRGNPAHYQEESFGLSNSTIIDFQRFMHCRKQWDINWQAVRVLL